jgi:hypothetical protein
MMIAFLTAARPSGRRKNGSPTGVTAGAPHVIHFDFITIDCPDLALQESGVAGP